MGKPVLKAIFLFLVYFSVVNLLTYLIIYATVELKLLDISESEAYWIEAFIYLILLCVAVMYSRKNIKLFSFKKRPSFTSVGIVCALAVAYRMAEDPLLRLDLVLGKQQVPAIEQVNVLPGIDLSVLLSIVLLGPLVEELVFRKSLLKFFTPAQFPIGIFISGILFALIHLSVLDIKYGVVNYQSVLLACPFGIFAAMLYITYGFWGCVLFHSAYNLLWFCLKNAPSAYWWFLGKFEFGISYWFIVMVAFGMVSLFLLYFLRLQKKSLPVTCIQPSEDYSEGLRTDLKN